MADRQPAASARPTSSLALIATSGAAGGLIRWGTLELTDAATLAVLGLNVVGSLLLGWMAGRGLLTRRRWQLLGVAFCGGLTTFSTFAVEVAAGLDDGQGAMAVGVTLLTLAAAVAAAASGHALGRAVR